MEKIITLETPFSQVVDEMIKDFDPSEKGSIPEIAENKIRCTLEKLNGGK